MWVSVEHRRVWIGSLALLPNLLLIPDWVSDILCISDARCTYLFHNISVKLINLYFVQSKWINITGLIKRPKKRAEGEQREVSYRSARSSVWLLGFVELLHLQFRVLNCIFWVSIHDLMITLWKNGRPTQQMLLHQYYILCNCPSLHGEYYF